MFLFKLRRDNTLAEHCQAASLDIQRNGEVPVYLRFFLPLVIMHTTCTIRYKALCEVLAL